MACAGEPDIDVVSILLPVDSVGEHVFGLLFSLLRKIPDWHQGLIAGGWEKHEVKGFELNGKTLGLVGFGNIDRRVAEIAIAFRMPSLAGGRSPEKLVKQESATSLGATFVTLDEAALYAALSRGIIAAGSHGCICGRATGEVSTIIA